MKTPLSEEPFGKAAMEKLNVGDLVKWTDLKNIIDGTSYNMGIVSDLYLEKRGNRLVALAKINMTSTSGNNDFPDKEVDILVVNLEVLSKIGERNNGRYSL
jgi:hypothetical protein